MAAPKNNKNAEKWNLQTAEGLIDKMIKSSEIKSNYLIGSGQNASYVEGYKFDFIGEISLEFGVYRELVTRDLRTRFEELHPKIDKLVKLMERNCYSNTKKGIINTAVGIVNLKSNHNWTDRVQNETNLTTNIPILQNDPIK